MLHIVMLRIHHQTQCCFNTNPFANQSRDKKCFLSWKTKKYGLKCQNLFNLNPNIVFCLCLFQLKTDNKTATHLGKLAVRWDFIFPYFETILHRYLNGDRYAILWINFRFRIFQQLKVENDDDDLSLFLCNNMSA